jgi:hypothetical protein
MERKKRSGLSTLAFSKKKLYLYLSLVQTTILPFSFWPLDLPLTCIREFLASRVLDGRRGLKGTQLLSSASIFIVNKYITNVSFEINTYDHRSVKTGHPVRSAIHKH